MFSSNHGPNEGLFRRALFFCFLYLRYVFETYADVTIKRCQSIYQRTKIKSNEISKRTNEAKT